MIEFDAGNNKYQTIRLNAFQQFDIARPLFPIVNDIMNAARDGMKPGDVMKIVGKAISEMPREEAHKVMKLCLAGVRRLVNGSWATVYLESADKLMFEDINLVEMLTISMRVIEDNLSGFFSGQP